MLKYDEFKAKLVNGIKNNIPKEYKNYSIELHSIKKLNQSLDGICILDKNADTVVSPVIYADELYGEYIKTDNLDTTIMLAVNMLIEHFTSLINPIEIPFKRFLNHQYLFPLLIVGATMFVCFLATYLPIGFSKKISLKEELKAND